MSHDLLNFTTGPQRIVCMTGETTEWWYLLGQEARIVGISGYTVRPRRAREGWTAVNAVRNNQLFEIKSPDILQPGPRMAEAARIMAHCLESKPPTKTSGGKS